MFRVSMPRSEDTAVITTATVSSIGTLQLHGKQTLNKDRILNYRSDAYPKERSGVLTAYFNG